MVCRKNVERFYFNAENSSCMPGKKDTVKVGGKKLQKYVLDDTVAITHKKYNFANPDAPVSLSTFSRCRPKNVLLVSYAKRNVCLCKRHQNFALLLKPLKQVGFPQSLQAVRDLSAEEVGEKIESLPYEQVRYDSWKTVSQPYKDTQIKRTTLVEQVERKEDFLQTFLSNFSDVVDHDDRVHAQYDSFTALKQNLGPSSATMQIDFAENYVCKFRDEITAAYYSKIQVTLHPAVFHFKSDDGKLIHKSLVVVSDEMSHKADTVFAFLESIIQWVKEKMPHIQIIHVLSDSPSSQYRNATIFSLVGHFQELFGVRGTWNYFESGHGKGPCDGVGGAVKRAADLATMKGQKIDDAQSFFSWGVQQESNSKVSYVLVEKPAVEEASQELKGVTKTSIVGTMKIHSVVPQDGVLFTRGTSCFKDCCWSGTTFHPSCDGWDSTELTPYRAAAEPVEVEVPMPVEPAHVDPEPSKTGKSLKKGKGKGRGKKSKNTEEETQSFSYTRSGRERRKPARFQ